MKKDEERFFITCYLAKKQGLTIRETINILYSANLINYKRCWYLLKKWDSKGFYNYGVTIDLGWFEDENMPLRYLNLINNKEVL